jgi:DNA repair photolyase
VHILTKSTLVERDIDILQKINEQNKAIVSLSFSSVNDAISEQLEPGVPAPSKRLETIKRLKQTGISCGMYLMPVVPFITDTREMIETAVEKAKEAGVDFVIFGGMTLKPGRQKEYFMRFLGERYPQLVPHYEQIYRNNSKWGAPESSNIDKGNKLFDDIATMHAIAKRIPSKLFENIVSTKELIIVILEQLDYLATLRGKNSPYGYAAYSLSQIKQPIETMNEEALLGIKGVGRFTAELIREIIETKRCGYYERLL